MVLEGKLTIKVLIGSKLTARRWISRGGVFVAEKRLIEGIDAGGEPSIQGVDVGVQRVDPELRRPSIESMRELVSLMSWRRSL